MKKLYKSVKLMVAKIYKNTCVKVYKIARRLLKKNRIENLSRAAFFPACN